MRLLRGQLLKHMPTAKPNTLIILLKKCETLLHCKNSQIFPASHIFPTKIVMSLTNCFKLAEQPAPGDHRTSISLITRKPAFRIADQVKPVSNCRHSHKISNTVKPVLGDHRWEDPNVVSQGRWSLRPGNQYN